MKDIQKIPPLENGKRAETGPMQFGDDWPGVFIRGDNALVFSMVVADALRAIPENNRLAKVQLNGLAVMLRSCLVGNTGWPPQR